MANMGSSRNVVLKLEKLIKNYINLKDNSTSKIELSSMNIEGEDLIDALDRLNFNTEEEIKEYRRIKVLYEEKVEEYEKLKEVHEESKEIYKELIKEVENFLKDPHLAKIKKSLEYLKEQEDSI